MKGFVFDIQRFTIHDGPGIRTAVFLKGCPLRCPWCQNPESIRVRPQIGFLPELCINCGSCTTACPVVAVRAGGSKLIDKVNLTLCTHCGKCADACCTGALRQIGRAMSVEEVVEVVMRDAAFYRESGGGVTFTGGEATYQPRFLAELATTFKRKGLHLVLETCGYFEWSPVAEALAKMDLFYCDIKHANSDKHRAVTGRGNEPILANVRRIDTLGKPIRVRIPLIPGFNDSVEDFSGIVRFASTLANLDKVQVLPYHKFGVNKYDHIGVGYSLRELEPPPSEAVAALLAVAQTEQVPCTL